MAEMDGKVVGFANLYERTAEWVFIGNVIVQREQRRLGLGRALVTHMLGQARVFSGLREARISVFGINNPALLLYGSFGFQPYALEERVDINGQRLALIHLRLSPAQ